MIFSVTFVMFDIWYAIICKPTIISLKKQNYLRSAVKINISCIKWKLNLKVPTVYATVREYISFSFDRGICFKNISIGLKIYMIFNCFIENFKHSAKSVQARSFSGLHFITFGLIMEIYFVNLLIQSKSGKIWTRKIPYLDTFHAVETLRLFGYTML